MTQRRFEEYVSEWRTKGHDWFVSQYTTAMLVRCDHSAEEAAHQFATVELDIDGALAATRKDESLGDVFPVVKRAGAPFPEYIGVGRVSTCDIPIPLLRISKFHAYISQNSEGAFTLADASSKNGTWIDGKRLNAREPVALGAIARVRFGQHRFIFCTPEHFHELVARASAG